MSDINTMESIREEGYIIALDDGSLVNIFAGEGTAFLLGTSKIDHFSNTVEKIRKIQRKKKRLNAHDKKEICKHLLFFEMVTKNVEPELFRERVPESEIECWLNFTIAEIKRFAKMPKWISTGCLDQHELYVLSNCLYLMNHGIVVALAFESDYFEAVGDLVKARRGKNGGRALPSNRVGELITLIVCVSYGTTQKRFDNNWPSERSFRRLDDSGVLEEFLRCATCPSAYMEGPESRLAVNMTRLLFESLVECPEILIKRFKRDGACGKVVRAILEGKDGSKTPRPDVIRRLQEIVTFVDSIDRNSSARTAVKICRACGKNDPSKAFQESLMRCGRCQRVFYCSKACQKADWKEHKKCCKPTTISKQKEEDAIKETIGKFANDQYVDIMVKMVRECEKTGTRKKDMVVHLDFRVNKDGIVPVMQDPPIFDVIPIQSLLDEGILCMQGQHSRMTPNHVLFYSTWKNGGQMGSKIASESIYSDEVFECFRQAVLHGEPTPLYTTLQPRELAENVCGKLSLKILMEKLSVDSMNELELGLEAIVENHGGSEAIMEKFTEQVQNGLLDDVGLPHGPLCSCCFHDVNQHSFSEYTGDSDDDETDHD